MSKFKRTKAITLPTLKMKIGDPIYVTILEVNRKENKKEKDPETGENKIVPVAKVTNLSDGENYELVCGAALIAQIEENYTKDELSGKSFEITKHDKKTGKRYHTYTIYEIDPEEGEK